MKQKLLYLSFLTLLITFYGYAQCNTIYVTPAGSSSGVGTINNPKSIAAAFASATNGTVIKIASGYYGIDNTLVIPANNVIIEGGFNSDFSLKVKPIPDYYVGTTIYRNATNVEEFYGLKYLIAVRAEYKSGFEIRDIKIETEALFYAANYLYEYNESATNYGIHLSSCSNYKIINTTINVGNGANGGNANPIVANSGVDGDNGTNGGNGSCDDLISAPGGKGGNSVPRGGDGGKGGESVWGVFGFLGSSTGGPRDGNGGSGGLGGDWGIPGQPGENGGNGENGLYGPDGEVAPYNSSNLYFVPSKGTRGGSGGNGGGAGGGGGGGGNDGFLIIEGTGNGGGGGGSGGSGGFGGYPSKGGGGSFGIYTFDNGSGGTIINCNISAGTAGKAGQFAGNGGYGGDGGVGGKGGETCTGETVRVELVPGFFITYVNDNEVGRGGNGGKGGRGGNGGSGGAAGDGISQNVINNGVALEYKNTYTPTLITIICPNDMEVTCNTIVLNQPQTSDPCFSGSITNNAPANFPMGITQVTWTAIDYYGKSSTCVQNVTVSPIVVTKDITVYLDEKGVALINASDIDGGSCGVSSLTVSKTSFSCADVGKINVILTGTDENGKSISKVAIVTVEENVISNCASLGVSDFNLPQVVLYPNPTKDSFAIKGLRNSSATVQIISSHGQIVETIFNYASGDISIKKIANGVYFIKIITDETSQTKSLLKND